MAVVEKFIELACMITVQNSLFVRTPLALLTLSEGCDTEKASELLLECGLGASSLRRSRLDSASELYLTCPGSSMFLKLQGSELEKYITKVRVQYSPNHPFPFSVNLATLSNLFQLGELSSIGENKKFYRILRALPVDLDHIRSISTSYYDISMYGIIFSPDPMLTDMLPLFFGEYLKYIEEVKTLPPPKPQDYGIMEGSLYTLQLVHN